MLSHAWCSPFHHPYGWSRDRKGFFHLPLSESESSMNSTLRTWHMSPGVWGAQVLRSESHQSEGATGRCSGSCLRQLLGEAMEGVKSGSQMPRGWERIRSGLQRKTMVCAKSLPPESSPWKRQSALETENQHSWLASSPVIIPVSQQTSPVPVSPPSPSLTPAKPEHRVNQRVEEQDP